VLPPAKISLSTSSGNECSLPAETASSHSRRIENVVTMIETVQALR